MRERSWRPARSNCTFIPATPRAGRALIRTIPRGRSRRSGPASRDCGGRFDRLVDRARPTPRQQQIRAWRVLPDYVSVNLIEEDAGEIIDLALEKGIGVEVGLWSASDAERFVADRNAGHCLRVLIEINEKDFSAGAAAVRRIIEILDAADIRLPRLLHGVEHTMWSVYREARRLGLDARIGFEDGDLLPSGVEADSNAALIRAAHALSQRIGVWGFDGAGPESHNPRPWLWIVSLVCLAYEVCEAGVARSMVGPCGRRNLAPCLV